MTTELKKEVDIIENFRIHIENNNIKYFKENKHNITPSNIHHLLDMCVFYNNEIIFDYLLTFDFADIGYDDSILFNYSVEVGQYDFTKKLALHPEIDVCNDDCWIARYVINNKIEALDVILSIEEIVNYITEEWIKEHIYSEKQIELFREKLNLYKKQINIKNF